MKQRCKKREIKKHHRPSLEYLKIRRISYGLWIILLALGALASTWSFLPQGSSTATSSNMAYMGVGQAIAMFGVICVVPFVLLAYLFNALALFRVSAPIKPWRVFETSVFCFLGWAVLAILIKVAWGKNGFVSLLAVCATLPIFIFWVANIVNFVRSQAPRTRHRLVELAFFTLPAVVILGFVAAGLYENRVSAAREKVAIFEKCIEDEKSQWQSQVRSYTNEIIDNQQPDSMRYYARLPKTPVQLYMRLHEYQKNAQANTPWKLEFVKQIEDPSPQMVLSGVSDGKGDINVSLAAYPQVRRTLEKGGSVRISTALGYQLVSIHKVNSGELMLGLSGGPFVPLHFVSACNA